ncbi:MAG: YggS family pyridoxal phosphate enzyme [Thiotrichales bacterium 32-46-8]|nr:MAG: YggS family pyridoxal phosphate enzyme [Thiotrichales bacterium 32-46-8]
MEDTLLVDRWHSIQSRIRQASLAAQRQANEVSLLAVSKFHSSDAIAALAEAGQLAFGENYVQELLAKAKSLTHLPIEWHFIGPLQSNKCKEIAPVATMIHSIDRLKLIPLLAQHRPAHLAPLQLLIQVNIDDEASKSGVSRFDEALELAKLIQTFPNLQLCGLMTIPKPQSDLSLQRHAFAQLRAWRDRLASLLGIDLPHLSMGMSDDLEAAIVEGATIVRIGTAIFGPRPSHSMTKEE